MKIALIQQQSSRGPDKNRSRGLDAVTTAAGQGARIICFSELAFDPFYPQSPATKEKLSLAEPIPGPTTESFAQLAAELSVVIILNLFERDGEVTFDTSPVINSDGKLLGTTRMEA